MTSVEIVESEKQVGLKLRINLVFGQNKEGKKLNIPSINSIILKNNLSLLLDHLSKALFL